MFRGIVFTLISVLEIELGHAAADLKSDNSHVSSMREVRHRHRFCKHVEGTSATAEQYRSCESVQYCSMRSDHNHHTLVRASSCRHILFELSRGKLRYRSQATFDCDQANSVALI